MQDSDVGLRLFLLELTGIAEVVVDRIYPQMLPEGAIVPAITYQTISSNVSYVSSGQSCYQQVDYQLDHWALTREEVTSLEDLTRQRLSGYRGRWPGGIRIGGIFQKNRYVFKEPESLLWRAISMYVIKFFA